MGISFNATLKGAKMLAPDMKGLLAKFNANPPATPSLIQQLESDTGLRLPEEYIDFLQQANGGEGFIGNSYLILWLAEELLEMNKAYEVEEYDPGLFLFGSDGGGEAYAFDTRMDSKPIVSVPFVGMELQLARFMASNFREFLEKLLGS
jgi:hypothetical protein